MKQTEISLDLFGNGSCEERQGSNANPNPNPNPNCEEGEGSFLSHLLECKGVRVLGGEWDGEEKVVVQVSNPDL